MPRTKKSSTKHHSHRDQDRSKGAVESGENQPSNTSLRGQLGHRDQDPFIKSADSDFPEPGGNPEHSGDLMAPKRLARED